MAGLVRWLGTMAREMERARAMMRHPQSTGGVSRRDR